MHVCTVCKRNGLDLYQLTFRSLSQGEGIQDGHQTPKLFECGRTVTWTIDPKLEFYR